MQDTINQFLEFRKQFTPRQWHEINRIIDGQFNKKPPSCNSTTKMLKRSKILLLNKNYELTI